MGMKRICLQVAAVMTMTLAVAAASSAGEPEKLGADLQSLGGQWWQWATSIPTKVNPLTDENGEWCAVGQRGPIWFLAGIFSGGVASRTCHVPQGVTLFFPVYNAINFDNVNECGQGSVRLTVADLRKSSAASVNAITKLTATIDGIRLKQVRRLRSEVFPMALPIDNLFQRFCSSHPLLGGIYPRAVDDGYYAIVSDLGVGAHTLQFSSSTATTTKQSVTYTLTVVAKDVR